MQRKVKNSARLVGEVISKYATDKVVILTIKTEKKDGERTRISFPKAICFEKVKSQTNNIQAGDFVLVDCTVQANVRDESIPNQSMKTIAVNHITKVDPNDERYNSVNSLRFYCRVLRTNRINDHVAVAKIFFFTTRAHYMTVVFKNDSVEAVDDFCSLQPNEYVILNGSIDTKKYIAKDGSTKYSEDCVIRNFRRTIRSKSSADSISENAEA